MLPIRTRLRLRIRIRHVARPAIKCANISQPEPPSLPRPNPNPLNWTLVTLLPLLLVLLLVAIPDCCCVAAAAVAVNFILQGIIRRRPRDLDFHANWIRNKGSPEIEGPTRRTVSDSSQPAVLAAGNLKKN